MTNPLDVIDKFYAEDSKLRRILLIHSWQVATRVMKCNAMHPELKLDRGLLFRGAMLHDIGIKQTYAPSIFCEGTDPYLMHGFWGARMLRQFGMEREARICERHTGAGMSQQAIIDARLNIEAKDYLPETLEEQLVCYADKFYSKSKPNRRLNAQDAYNGLLRFGEEGAERFKQWDRLFGNGEL